MAITYNDLYLDIRRQLRLAGAAASTLEARELVCFGTGSVDILSCQSRAFWTRVQKASNSSPDKAGLQFRKL